MLYERVGLLGRRNGLRRGGNGEHRRWAGGFDDGWKRCGWRWLVLQMTGPDGSNRRHRQRHHPKIGALGARGAPRSFRRLIPGWPVQWRGGRWTGRLVASARRPRLAHNPGQVRLQLVMCRAMSTDVQASHLAAPRRMMVRTMPWLKGHRLIFPFASESHGSKNALVRLSRGS